MEKGLEKLESIFECSICCEMFNEVRCPMVIPCGHTICAYCIAHMTCDEDEITCPTDKLTFDASECSKNYSLAEALEAVEQLVGKLKAVKIVNPTVKRKLRTLEANFKNRDVQQVKDQRARPVLKPKANKGWSEASYEEYEYNDYSGYNSPYEESYSEQDEDFAPEELEESKSVEVCWHFQKFRTCNYGDRCKYSHDVPEEEEEEEEHRPRYPGKKCYRIMETGDCQFGNKCWYSHEVSDSEDTW
jgi:hypothetical protein